MHAFEPLSLEAPNLIFDAALDATGDDLVLIANAGSISNTNGAGNHGVEADMDILVPAGAAVDVASKRGDVTINDRKAEVKRT